jgi:hypothetical protein
VFLVVAAMDHLFRPIFEFEHQVPEPCGAGLREAFVSGTRSLGWGGYGRSGSQPLAPLIDRKRQSKPSVRAVPSVLNWKA